VRVKWRLFDSWLEFRCYLIILVACVAGLTNVAWWAAVPTCIVLLLWASDRGQHRWLVKRFPGLSPVRILTLSIGASLLNNTFFVALAHVFGRFIAWLWSE
jgi:hypothetical protein